MITASVSAAILWYYVNNQRYVSIKSITLTLFLIAFSFEKCFLYVPVFFCLFSLFSPSSAINNDEDDEQTIRL